MSYENLPDGWVVWNDKPDGRSVLAYRPDVFDADEFPAECLPTIYLTKGRPSRRPAGDDPIKSGSGWTVILYLEPEVERDNERFDDREAAVRRVVELAEAFAAGEIDYRGLYQVPRPEYFEKLDELTGE
jgi:hypothetical protein